MARFLRRLHVLAAVPVSAAVALGRVHDADVHPCLVVYDRTGGQYSAALEISWILQMWAGTRATSIPPMAPCQCNGTAQGRAGLRTCRGSPR
ncbi:hypothetical protein [Streptomyces hyaluromycini]|uniref:hypothetical protein n=1 Tax=Streptomyces hyaluromycini TaxID=1377993 RepID=UPI000B5D02EE|nr:hypothetical protein [Streptomyces hyaluromycini]